MKSYKSPICKVNYLFGKNYVILKRILHHDLYTVLYAEKAVCSFCKPRHVINDCSNWYNARHVPFTSCRNLQLFTFCSISMHILKQPFSNSATKFCISGHKKRSDYAAKSANSAINIQVQKSVFFKCKILLSV
jgi:hypothetical protein